MTQGAKDEGFDSWRKGIKHDYLECMSERSHAWERFGARAMNRLPVSGEKGFLITRRCMRCLQFSTYERDSGGARIQGSGRMKYDQEYLAPSGSGGLSADERGELWIENILPITPKGGDL